MIKKIFTLIMYCCVWNVFANDLPFEGNIIMADSQFSAKFKLIKDDKDNRVIVFSPKSSRNSCSFIVKRITSPQGTRGMKGLIFTNRVKNCTFEIANNTEMNFWNDVILVDFEYTFTEGGYFDGIATVNTLEKSYQANLSFSKQ
ncbi:hypothetical protein N9B72_00575 [Bacteriovoracaceae bacterium]|jgi:hypothetical protein|nr:hypothetical protein [Bacteriovoracaceae bacterium]